MLQAVIYGGAALISIIVPTYNERDNITKLIPILSRTLEGYELEVIVVDDNSPDGTAIAAEELSKSYPVKVLKRNGKLGLASAVVLGFQHAKGDILGVIDADMQHPPDYLKNFVLAILDGHDIAAGSRYVKGGKLEGWGNFRSLVSWGAIMLSKPLTGVKDPMSGYFMLKRRVIEGVSFNPMGYKIFLEILVKGSYDNVTEIPYIFRNREAGESKLKMGEYVNYLRLLYHLYGFRLRRMLNGR